MMRDLEIRTGDPLLKAALECWWNDYGEKCPEGHFSFTDLDSLPALGAPNELTCSKKQPADLIRPFSFEELEKLIEERQKKAQKRLIKQKNTFFLDGKPLSLSALEEKILTILYHENRPISAQALSLALWGEVRPSNQINVYIRYLRQKTDLPGRERLIFTAHREGFYLKND